MQKPRAEILFGASMQKPGAEGLSGATMQKLSKRLQAVADFVTAGYRLADVGTDHGYVPIALVQRGVIPSAIAMDINRGPLDRAREHILAAGLEQRIEIRLSDGLEKLREGEADSVLLAGMGGMLTLRILDAKRSLVSGLKELVLEPQSDVASVREYVRTHDLCIDREELVLEDGKYYPILHVVSAAQAQYALEHERELVKQLQERLEDAAGTPVGSCGQNVCEGMQERLSECASRQSAGSCGQNVCKGVQEHLPEVAARRLVDQYGACLIRNRHPVLLQLLARDELRQRKILEALPEPGMSGTSDARRQEVLNNLMRIRSLQTYFSYTSINHTN